MHRTSTHKLISNCHEYGLWFLLLIKCETSSITTTLVPSWSPWCHHHHLGTIMITLVGGRPFSTSLASRHNWRVRQSGVSQEIRDHGNVVDHDENVSIDHACDGLDRHDCWEMVTNIILVIFDGAFHGDEDFKWDKCCVHGNNIKSWDEFQSCHRCARAGWFIIGGII